MKSEKAPQQLQVKQRKKINHLAVPAGFAAAESTLLSSGVVPSVLTSLAPPAGRLLLRIPPPPGGLLLLLLLLPWFVLPDPVDGEIDNLGLTCTVELLWGSDCCKECEGPEFRMVALNFPSPRSAI